jgi:hypothetical protein
MDIQIEAFNVNVVFKYNIYNNIYFDNVFIIIVYIKSEKIHFSSKYERTHDVLNRSKQR